MKNQQSKDIIEATQRRLWDAKHFIAVNANPTYWEGVKGSAEFTLDAFRAVGISVSEVVDQMPVEDIGPLVDIAQKAFVLLDEGSDSVSMFVKQELAKLLRVDESDVSWQTPEWQRVQEIVRSLV